MSEPSSPLLQHATTTSLWLDQIGTIQQRSPLDGDIDTDVAIVGGGFSGLWTAYYLKQLDPSLRVTLLEKHYCGFGASGRNGGWAVGELAATVETYAERSSLDASMRLLRAVFGSVDEVGRVAAAEAIECGYAKGGWIRLARTGPQATRQRDEVAHHHSLGLTEDDVRLLTADEARVQLNGTDVRSGVFFAHCAAVDPARLARGLADAAEAIGVHIAEGTAVTAIEDGRVETTAGTVTADVVVQATEAYTRDLKGQRRDMLPTYALMVATEPLDDAVFEEIGLADRQTFSDDRYMVIYGQRTEDNRLAFGGAAVPYRWGSTISQAAELHSPSHDAIYKSLVEILPVLESTRFTHRWGGVLGIPRHWTPAVRFDRLSGRGELGGYVGEGVAAANLAGQTMADLIIGEETDRTTLPWVGVPPRRWEPEPLRWIGVRGSRRIFAAADRREAKTDSEATLALRVAELIRRS